MPYSKNSIPKDHTEFGGGPGLIDPVLRKDRLLTNEEQLIEIYATNPAGGEGAQGTTDAEIAARKAELERLADPENAIIERP